MREREWSTTDDAILAQTEADLRLAIERYIAARSSATATEDMTDDAMAAMIESIAAGWGIDISARIGGA